jgi:hypothetical protein
MDENEIRRLLDAGAAGKVDADFDQVHRRAAAARRRLRRAAVIGTAAIVTAAIVVPVIVAGGSDHAVRQGTPRPTPRPTAPVTATVPTDPAELVGVWQVGRGGRSTTATLRLGAELSVREPCGVVFGEWRADRGGRFIGRIDSGYRACVSSRTGEFGAPWMAQVESYRVDGSSRLLLDASGSVVATLTPAASTSRPKRPSWLDQTRRPLPNGLQPATVADLVLHRWQAVVAQLNPRSYLQFDPDTAWSGSDGCNGVGGRYQIGGGGELLLVSGLVTAVGCGNSPASLWLEQASRIGIAGGDLVLVDRGGAVLGRLTEQPTGVLTGRFREVGGPYPGIDHALAGLVEVHDQTATGPVVGYATSTDGRFTIAVPPGRYVLVGTSPSVVGARCSSAGAITVRVGATSHGLVLCQLN